MKSISSLHIRGFQSHVDTLLELHPGMNILIGPSDSGKTAIQRAIRWAAHNEPLGDGYVNAKTGKASVSMALSDGGSVVRFRASGNAYEVNGHRLEGFGTRVPDEVVLATGMHKAAFGDEQVWLNYSAQLDAPFMLSETSGQAARILGKIAGTEDLDVAGKMTNSDLIKERSRRSMQQDLSAKLAIQLMDYDNLAKAEDALEMLQSIWAEHKERIARAEHLRKASGRLLQIEQSLHALSTALEQITIPDLVDIKQQTALHARCIAFDAQNVSNQYKYNVWEGRRAAVNGLLSEKQLDVISHLKQQSVDKTKAAALAEMIERNRKSTQLASQRMEVSIPMSTLEHVKAVYNDCRKLQDIQSRDNMWVMRASKTKDELVDFSEAVAIATSQLEKYLVEMKVCPVCHAAMDKERIHSHVRSLAGGKSNE